MRDLSEPGARGAVLAVQQLGGVRHVVEMEVDAHRIALRGRDRLDQCLRADRRPLGEVDGLRGQSFLGGIGEEPARIEQAEETAAIEVGREDLHHLAALGRPGRRRERDGIGLHTRAGHVDGGTLRTGSRADGQRAEKQSFHGLKLISTPSRTSFASSGGGGGKRVRCNASTSA